MNDVYSGLEPVELWRHFDALNGIGRPSGNEAAARQYVQQIASESNCSFKTDTYGNCVVYVPSRTASTSPVCVQAHLDMVKATAPGVTHDFDHDPIVPQRDGDRITATGTTLGADNGIGAAAALALITDTSLKTGPLELLFTVEEETGLKGAAALDGSLLTSKALINLDSEDPSTLTIGCAGGEGVMITVPVKREPVPADWSTWEVRIGGLRGGHSGVEIHKNLTNAIKYVLRRSPGLRLASINGGSAHNAVPKEATAQFCVPQEMTEEWAGYRPDPKLIDEMRTKLSEPGLTVEIDRIETSQTALSIDDTAIVIDMLYAIKTGVITMSPVFSGKVQTSQNLAIVKTTDDAIEILVSIRSFVAADIQAAEDELRRVAEAAGATLTVSSAYPSWEPNPSSTLLRTTMETFEHIMGKAPIVEVIHAGLECGVISAKVPGMEAISFGPTITGAHTPEEAVYPESVKSTWKLLVEVLRRLS